MVLITHLIWKEKFPGNSNHQLLIKDGKVLVTVNWDVIEQQYFARQGQKGNPQYIFKSLKFGDIEKAKDIVFKAVSKKVN